MRKTISFAAAALALAACFEKKPEAEGGPDAKAYAEATEVAAVLAGDDKGSASENDVCKLFMPNELEAYIGEPVGKPQNAAMGSGCQWLAKDGEGDVMIQIVGKDYHEPHSLAEGFRELAGPGEEAFVEQAWGGWSAGAIVGEHSVIAMVAGAKAGAETAEALLRETVKRRAGR